MVHNLSDLVNLFLRHPACGRERRRLNCHIVRGDGCHLEQGDPLQKVEHRSRESVSLDVLPLVTDKVILVNPHSIV